MKKIKAFNRYRDVLVDLANIPEDHRWPWAVRDFLKKHGPLARHPWASEIWPGCRAEHPLQMAEMEVVQYASVVRQAWEMGSEKNEHRREEFNIALSALLAPGDPIKGEAGAVLAKFDAEKMALRPDTLLHKVVLALVGSLPMLRRCDECGRYMVKECSQDKYCLKGKCKDRHRLKQQVRYESEHREQRNQKRRKPTQTVLPASPSAPAPAPGCLTEKCSASPALHR